MEFWPEFLASSTSKEFVAGGFGGTAGIISGYPLDTLRVMQQNSNNGSVFTILRNLVAKEGPTTLYRGMAAPLASVTFHNAMVFQIYAVLSRAFSTSVSVNDPPSYKGVALGGFCSGVLQSMLLSPVELLKIQLQNTGQSTEPQKGCQQHKDRIAGSDIFSRKYEGIFDCLPKSVKEEGYVVLWRGLGTAVVNGAIFSAYEITLRSV